MDLSNLPVPIAVVESLVLAVLLWALWFVWAPRRAIKAGLKIDDPPLSLRMQPFQILRVLALLGMLALAYSEPAQSDLLKVDYPNLINRMIQGDLAGPLIALGLVAALLFGLPEMTAHGRLKRKESPGEWLTAALVLFRWFWLGVVLLACGGYLQRILPFADMLGFPLSPAGGVAIAGLGGLIYVVWWGLPGTWTAQAAEAGSSLAHEALSRVRWRGLPAYFKFTLMGRAKGGDELRQGAPKLCPSCMRPVAKIELYETLRFDLCPHCGEIMPPVFKIDDYIRYNVEMYMQLHALQQKKRFSKQSSKREADIVQRLLGALLSYGYRERGTDLHLQVEGGRFVVRCRTDGVLFTLADMPEELGRPFISVIKVQSQMDISERRKPQDGSFKTVTDGNTLDVRVNTSPVPNGETASLRLLYRNQTLGALDRLGLSPRHYRVFIEGINAPHGLILVTGPTGSGKSTTLYNALGQIADGKRNIITLEDPIEFKIEGLTQMEVNPAKNFGFASGLRTILRQDPDVIMVGEVRDTETAKMAIDAAMTGHLVFSTLHTIDTHTTVGRLWDLGVDPHRHSEALLMIVAQRLVRMVCDRCRKEYVLTAEELDRFGLPRAPQNFTSMRGEGCERCHETGFYGREGIYEVFRPDERIKDMIANKAILSDIRRAARNQGMRTLLEDGLVKVILGRTTLDEVLRVTS